MYFITTNCFCKLQERRAKWWKPITEEQRKQFEAAKDDVVCYLSILKEGLRARKAYGNNGLSVLLFFLCR